MSTAICAHCRFWGELAFNDNVNDKWRAARTCTNPDVGVSDSEWRPPSGVCTLPDFGCNQFAEKPDA